MFCLPKESPPTPIGTDKEMPYEAEQYIKRYLFISAFSPSPG